MFTGSPGAIASGASSRRPATRPLTILARLASRPAGAIGLVGSALFVLLAVVGPLVFGDQALKMGSPALLGPSAQHLMGTDEFGRDVLSRVVVGVRVSLVIGVGAVLLGGLVGVLTGIVAGYAGGWVEAVVMRVWDALLAFPSIFVAIGTAALLGAGVRNIIVAVAIVNMPTFARLVRASTLAEKKKEYVDAVRTVGVGPVEIMLGEIWPNIAAPIFVAGATAAPAAILLAAALDFLGLGEQPPAPSLGQMVSASRQFLQNDAWYAVFPGLVLVVLVLVLSLLGTSLPDALNPARRVVRRKRT
jgi:peptide/nickel transport system permease protein